MIFKIVACLSLFFLLICFHPLVLGKQARCNFSQKYSQMYDLGGNLEIINSAPIQILLNFSDEVSPLLIFLDVNCYIISLENYKIFFLNMSHSWSSTLIQDFNLQLHKRSTRIQQKVIFNIHCSSKILPVNSSDIGILSSKPAIDSPHPQYI